MNYRNRFLYCMSIYSIFSFQRTQLEPLENAIRLYAVVINCEIQLEIHSYGTEQSKNIFKKWANFCCWNEQSESFLLLYNSNYLRRNFPFQRAQLQWEPAF